MLLFLLLSAFATLTTQATVKLDCWGGHREEEEKEEGRQGE